MKKPASIYNLYHTRACLVFLHALLFFNTRLPGEDVAPPMDPVVRERLDQTVEAMGGDAFLAWKDYSSFGRYFAFKKEGQGWMKFWYYYKWKGMERTEFEEQKTGIIEIYNLTVNSGWTYDYGSVKEKTPEEMRDFMLAEKRNLVVLFRERWKEPGMKVFFMGPKNFKTIQPVEALEFLDADNYSVMVYFEEGTHLPFKAEYVDRNSDGVQVKKEERYYRWFKFQGVCVPMRIEFYTEGRASGLAEFETMAFDKGLSESMFQKPEAKPEKKKKKKPKEEVQGLS